MRALKAIFKYHPSSSDLLYSKVSGNKFVHKTVPNRTALRKHLSIVCYRLNKPEVFFVAGRGVDIVEVRNLSMMDIFLEDGQPKWFIKTAALCTCFMSRWCKITQF